jgi:protein pelota
MKIIFKDLRKAIIKVSPESKDDLWYLSQIIEAGDLVSGQTERKIKIGDSSSDRNVKVIRRMMFLELRVEKVELSESLRVLGIITKGPDDIPHGEYHSFDLNPNDHIEIKKEHWLKFQLQKLEYACEVDDTNVLMIAFDREEAFLAVLKKSGITHLTHLSGDVQKKAVDEKKADFYEQLIKVISDYEEKNKFTKIIMASPAFWKDEAAKYIDKTVFKSKVAYATCSDVGKGSFNEVLKRPEVATALKDVRTSSELNLVEELLKEIAKSGPVTYGFKQVENAVTSGAVKHLLVTDGIISSMREKGAYFKLENLMKNTDSIKADITIIDSRNDAGKKLDGLGGIGALLRYKI